MSETRLTPTECQAVADRTMLTLEDMDAAQALRRFEIGRCHVEEMAIDEVTGLRFRRMIFASRWTGSAVLVTVTVSAEPRIVRHARRFRLLAALVEGWRSAPQGQATKVLEATGEGSASA